MSVKMLTAMLILVLGAGLAAAESPIDPYKGTWRVNFDLSYMRALADENLPQRDPQNLQNLIANKARLAELAIADSLITFSRGRHSVPMEFEVVEILADKIVLDVISSNDRAFWELTLNEHGYLHILSSATNFNDFYIYERGEIPRDENGLPVALPQNMRRPVPMGIEGSREPETQK